MTGPSGVGFLPGNIKAKIGRKSKQLNEDQPEKGVDRRVSKILFVVNRMLALLWNTEIRASPGNIPVTALEQAYYKLITHSHFIFLHGRIVHMVSVMCYLPTKIRCPECSMEDIAKDVTDGPGRGKSPMTTLKIRSASRLKRQPRKIPRDQ